MALFVPLKFKSYVQLVPAELGKDLGEVIRNKLRKTYEGVCSRYGYVKPGSLQILQRSYGQFIKQHFNGHIRFEVVMMGEVCNPLAGMVVTAQVRNRNQMGIKAESFIEVDGKIVPVLDIIIPKRSAGIQSDFDLDEIQIGENIHVEVVGKRYQLNDTRISIIGRAVNMKKDMGTRRSLDANAATNAIDVDGDMPNPDQFNEDEDTYDPDEDNTDMMESDAEEDTNDEPRASVRTFEIADDDLLGELRGSDGSDSEDYGMDDDADADDDAEGDPDEGGDDEIE